MTKLPISKVLPQYHRAVLELILAGTFWGISFTFVKWALIDFSPSTLVFWRFLLALILAEGLYFLLDRENYKKSHSDLKLGLFAGVSLGGALIFQTMGLTSTTATNSSFITSLYVVMIPLANAFFFKTQVKWHHFVLSAFAFLGMGLLLDLPTVGFNFNPGDLLTLLAAVTSTFHIIAVGLAAKKMKSGFRFNTAQTLWAWVFIMPFLGHDIFSKNIPLIPEITSYASILSIIALAVFVSIGAFYLQVRAQKVLNTTTASMLCLLEAPYSFLFASVLLKESLNAVQLVGAMTILLVSMVSVYIDKPKHP